MRNVAGHRFPHTADPQELASVLLTVENGLANCRGMRDATKLGRLSSVERDRLVADRLISPEFAIQSLHRKLWLDPRVAVSAMINEEDHVRLQVLNPGWRLDDSRQIALRLASELGEHVDFAWSPTYGFLAASPYNCGAGMRISAMFHLIGLAHLKKLRRLLELLGSQTIVARGLFGEHSRAVGAIVQVSVLGDELPLLLGAGDVLIAEEREARAKIGGGILSDQAVRAREYAISSRSISLADAIRTYGWVRWASTVGLDGFDRDLMRVDLLLRHLSLCSVGEEGRSAERRAKTLRVAFEKHR